MLYVLIGGIFFCAVGFFWSSRLIKYEIEHRNARGVLRFTRYQGHQVHENHKAWASLFRTVGVLLLIAVGIFYSVPFLK